MLQNRLYSNVYFGWYAAETTMTWSSSSWEHSGHEYYPQSAPLSCTQLVSCPFLIWCCEPRFPLQCVSHALPDLSFWHLQKNNWNVCASYSCLNRSPETNTIFIIICFSCNGSQIPARFLHLHFLYWQTHDSEWSGWQSLFKASYIS